MPGESRQQQRAEDAVRIEPPLGVDPPVVAPAEVPTPVVLFHVAEPVGDVALTPGLDQEVRRTLERRERVVQGNSNETCTGKNQWAKLARCPPVPRRPCMLGEQKPSIELTPAVRASSR